MSKLSQTAGSSLSPELLAVGEKYKLNKVETRFLGPLLLHLEKPGIREIVINKPQQIGFELMDGTWEFVEAPELTEELLDDAARMLANMSNQLFTPTHPILTCKLPGGHRVQVVAGKNAKTKFTMAIRLKNERRFSIDDYEMSAEDKALIIDCIKTQKTLLVSGGTSTGKTSFLNAILPYIPDHERLITMEDVAELELPHENWTPLLFTGSNEDKSGKMILEVLNACLRMRPDRIILGEIRKENAFAFCSAINTGHEGSLATIHANSPKLAIDAVLNRVMLNGDVPESALNALKRQLVADIYGVVQLERHGPKVTGYFQRLATEDDLG